MFIDIHVHAFKYKGFHEPFRGKPFASPEDLLEQYDRLDIEKGVLLPLVSPEARKVIQSSEEIIAICEEYPDRFIPFCNIDPRSYKNTADSPLNVMMYYYMEKGCKGIGEITANMPINHPMVQNLFKCAEEAELPIIFHLSPEQGYSYGLVDEIGLPLLEHALQKYPDLKFLGHSQCFWAEMAPIKDPEDRKGYPKGKIENPGRVVELMRKYPNLYGDLSAGSGANAVSRDKEFGIKFLNEFQDRLYFGTDICSKNGKTPLRDYLIKLLDEGSIKKDVFNKISRENAIKLLDL